MEGNGVWGPERNISATSPTPSNGSLLDIWGDDAAVTLSDASFGVRMFTTVVYSVVCAAGLLGNGLVMCLIRAQKGRTSPVINVFVFGLAVADFQFSLTLPFWAVEMAADFHWPFGHAACKAVTSLTVLSVYTNVFLLTAMSVVRYWSVASAIKGGSRVTPRLAKWITAALWVLAIGATVPTAIYAKVVDFADDELCIFKFPARHLQGIYHLQRVLLTFVIPLAAILASYVLLLRLLKTHHVNGSNLKRQSQVATTVRLVVGSFFVCWFPNQVLTTWGVLIKFEALPMCDTFHFFHSYIFPLTTCLAHASSCLNPLLYCLIRKEFRQAMRDTFRRLAKMASPHQHPTSRKTGEEAGWAELPLSPSGLPSNPESETKEDSTLSTITEPRAKAPNPGPKVQLIPGAEVPM